MHLKRIGAGVLSLGIAAVLLAAAPQAVQADPPFTPPGHSKKGGGPPGTQKFGYGKFCPPGLRDKGCVPPGQQKFRRGDRIPHWRDYDRLRYREYGLLEPGPGRSYIRIGNEAYLIAETTQQVIDVINLLNR